MTKITLLNKTDKQKFTLKLLKKTVAWIRSVKPSSQQEYMSGVLIGIILKEIIQFEQIHFK